MDHEGGKFHNNSGLPDIPQTIPQLVSAELPAGRALRAPAPAILIVNEQADILDEVACLRRRNHSVQVAGSAREARIVLQADPAIGVVLADIGLLEGEGLTLAARILGGRTQAPVELILITGFSGQVELPGGTLLSDIGLLREPLKLRDIAASVSQALGRAAARRKWASRGPRPVRMNG